MMESIDRIGGNNDPSSRVKDSYSVWFMRDTVAKWTPYQACYIRDDWSAGVTYYACYIREESSKAVLSHFDFNLAISGSHI